ncbi:MAG: DNA mismatch repair protein MutS [Bacteroidota bacterium]
MFSNRKKKTTERLIKAFGKLKEGSFNFGYIESYFHKKEINSSEQALSDKTCDDLDFQELFMFLDRTSSKVGQQYFYSTLRSIRKDNIGAQYDTLIEHFASNTEFRISVQLELDKLNNNGAFHIASLFQDSHLQRPKWFIIIQLLSLVSVVSLLAIPFYPVFFLVSLGLFIINMIVHYWNKRNLPQYLSSIPQLLILNRVGKSLFAKSDLKSISPELPKSLNITDRIKNRMSFFQLESRLQGDLESLAWGLLELFKILFLLEPLLLFGILRQLDTKRQEIEELFKFVGIIDSLISIASLRAGLDEYCVPSVSDESKSLIAKDIYHPLIIDCVKNDLSIKSKSILLTGSNMSGKTSFIRTIGLNVISALTINTCFAKEFRLTYLNILSAIRISDDLLNDKSYYFEEVLTIKEMITQSKDDGACLFLLDEIFKGTNTVERIAAGKAVLSALNGGNNIVLVSTHDIELADLLKEEYDLYHFSEKVDDKNVDFDYKLKTGKLQKRNAIKILEINDYPKEIVSEAIQIAEKLDQISPTKDFN